MDPHWTESFDELLNTELNRPPESAYSFRPAGRRSGFKSYESSPYRATPRSRPQPRLLQSPMSFNSDHGSTKSVAYAMRALQDRIRELEDSQGSLLRKLEESEQTGSKIEAKWRSRLSEELKLSQERTQAANDELNSTRLRLAETDQRLKEQTDKSEILEREVRGLTEALASSRVELLHIEKKMRRQVEVVNHQFDARKDEFERLKLGLQQANYEKQLMEDELNKSQESVYSLSQELAQAKEHIENMMKDTEIQLNSQDVELSRKVAETTQQLRRQEFQLLNSENEREHLQKLVTQLNGQIEGLKAKLVSLENDKEQVKQEYSKTQEFIKEVSAVNERLVDSLNAKHRTRRHHRRSDLSLKSPNYSIDLSAAQTPHGVSLLEREISDLNSQYKLLLKKASEKGADTESIRAQLNAIAAAMEAKSRDLYTMRQNQLDSQLQV